MTEIEVAAILAAHRPVSEEGHNDYCPDCRASIPLDEPGCELFQLATFCQELISANGSTEAMFHAGTTAGERVGYARGLADRPLPIPDR